MEYGSPSAKYVDATHGTERPERIDLTEMARQVMADLQQREPHREAQIVIADGLSAHGDASLLGAAIENLLSNAWKFSARKSRTQIEFGKKLDQPQPIFFVRRLW